MKNADLNNNTGASSPAHKRGRDDADNHDLTQLQPAQMLKLTPVQEQVVVSIDKSDYNLFKKIGGPTTVDLNFDISVEGIFPLMMASAKGDAEMVNLILLNPKTDINKCDPYGVNSFWIASYYSKIDVMKLLIQKGIDMMCKNQNGSNALHIAVKRENFTVVKALLDIHYPLDYPKNNGVTAIGIAAFGGSLELCDLLYFHGADVNFKNKNGINPLYLAIKQKHNDVAKYLISKKASIHIKEPKFEDYSPLFITLKTDNIEILKYICENGFKISDITNKEGYSPYSYSALWNSKQCLEYLTERSKSVDEKDPLGYSPFMRCISHGNLQQAEILLQKGANPNHLNGEGLTSLMLAIKLENEEAVRFLLNKNMDIHFKDRTGKDACDYAMKSPIFKSWHQFQKCPKNQSILTLQPSDTDFDIKKAVFDMDTTETDSVSGLIPIHLVTTRRTKSKMSFNEQSPDIQSVKRKTRELSKNRFTTDTNPLQQSIWKKDNESSGRFKLEGDGNLFDEYKVDYSSRNPSTVAYMSHAASNAHTGVHSRERFTIPRPRNMNALLQQLNGQSYESPHSNTRGSIHYYDKDVNQIERRLDFMAADQRNQSFADNLQRITTHTQNSLFSGPQRAHFSDMNLKTIYPGNRLNDHVLFTQNRSIINQQYRSPLLGKLASNILNDSLEYVDEQQSPQKLPKIPSAMPQEPPVYQQPPMQHQQYSSLMQYEPLSRNHSNNVGYFATQKRSLPAGSLTYNPATIIQQEQFAQTTALPQFAMPQIKVEPRLKFLDSFLLHPSLKQEVRSQLANYHNRTSQDLDRSAIDDDDSKSNPNLFISYDKNHVAEPSLRYDSITKPIRELVKKQSPHVHKNRIKKQKINGQTTLQI